MRAHGETLEDLGGGLRVFTARGRTFGIDALLLADFADCERSGRACDLGTGCGVLPLLLSRKFTGLRIDAAEINAEASDAARRSTALCGLSGTVTVLTGDYRTPAFLPAGCYGLVVCNPPFFKSGSGGQSSDPAQRAARHETCAAFGEIAAVAASLLRNGGRFCFCQLPERLPEVFAALRENGLEPKCLRFAQHDAGHAPFLFLCDARKNVLPGLYTAPALLLRSENGPSAELLRIYGQYTPPGHPVPEIRG